MAYSDSQYFTYAGRHCTEFGVFQASLRSGTKTDLWTPNREVVTERIFGRETSYYYGNQYDPMEFEIDIYVDYYKDTEKMSALFQWLHQDDFKPLVFEDYPNQVYYAMVVGTTQIEHNSVDKGIVSLAFLCNHSFPYSPTYTKTVIAEPSSEGETVTTFTIDNMGARPIFLHTVIIKDVLGDITIENTTNGLSFTLVNSLADEEIEIDAQNQIIATSLPLTYRYNDFSGDFMKLAIGTNTLKITGSGEFQFTYAEILG